MRLDYGPVCPYCQVPARLGNGTDVGWSVQWHDKAVWLCPNWPTCTAYVTCHPGTSEPLGSLANFELREMCKEAHRLIDPLWRGGLIDRDDAYLFVHDLLALPPFVEAHVGTTDIVRCRWLVRVLTAKRAVARAQVLSARAASTTRSP